MRLRIIRTGTALDGRLISERFFVTYEVSDDLVPSRLTVTDWFDTMEGMEREVDRLILEEQGAPMAFERKRLVLEPTVSHELDLWASR